MDEVEKVSGLIGNIYDAALDRSLWPLVLEQTCEYIGGCASSLMSQDFVRRSGLSFLKIRSVHMHDAVRLGL